MVHSRSFGVTEPRTLNLNDVYELCGSVTVVSHTHSEHSTGRRHTEFVSDFIVTEKERGKGGRRSTVSV